MFIVYIAFGVASGLIAATVTLLSGASFFMAFLAYALAGLGGMLAGLIWAGVPKNNTAKHTVTQRS